MIDNDTLTPADLAEADAAADEITARLADDEAQEAAPDDAELADQIAATPDDDGEHGERGAPQAPAPAAPNPEAVRQQIAVVAANDPDLALAQRPDLWDGYAQSDPRGFIAWKARAEAKVQQLAAVEGQLRLEEERARLARALPEYVDRKTGPSVREGTKAFLREQGFSDSEISSIADHRVLAVVDQARKYAAVNGAPKRGRSASLAKSLAGKGLHDQAAAIAKLL